MNEILNLTPDGVSALLTEVESTTEIYDRVVGSEASQPVPGRPDERYIPFGADDQLPYELKQIIDGDEVTAQCVNFNVSCLYGAGPTLSQPDEAGEKWLSAQDITQFLLEQATDLQIYFFAVAVIILSRDGRRINRIVHKEAPYIRFAAADRHGRIPYVYYADFHRRRPRPDEIERIEALDLHDPIGDLRGRLGWDRTPPRKTTRTRKFAIISRYPTAGCQYYPVPYWSSILRGGSYDEKRLISVGKRAKLRNHTGVKYHVEIQKDYWARICREEYITEPDEQAARIRREKENIRQFLSGLENSGKVWISTFYVNPDGTEISDVRIRLIEGQKEGGEWSEDIQAAANTICFAFGVHPNMVGAVPGKSQSNNSGSDKRELYIMKQYTLTPAKHILLRALNLCFQFNGFAARPVLPIVQLNTLDTHTDAKIVTPAPAAGA